MSYVMPAFVLGRIRLPFLLVAGALFLTSVPSAVRAQGAAAQPVKVVTPQLDFSGIIFGSYQFRTDSAARATLGGAAPNQFNIDRVYLTFRMPVGDNALIRATSDIFQQTSAATNGYYRGWVVRLKYGYLQYTLLKNSLGDGSNVQGRIGMLHTVLIDHEESFWPRYLGNTAVERNGFFLSSDLGAAGLITLPDKLGEVYGTITNGPGYTAPETDRFKDFALRVTLTPFANDSSLLKTFAISPWAYKGFVGSAFATGGAGQLGPGTNGAITDGLTHDRYGIFAGLKDRRLTVAGEYAQRKDGSETGLNTANAPRASLDSSGRILSGFIVARPMELMDNAHRSPFGVVARYDRFTPNTGPLSPTYAGTTPSYDVTIVGLFWDPTPRTTFSADWQVQRPTGFPDPAPRALKLTPRQSSLYLHWQATY